MDVEAPMVLAAYVVSRKKLKVAFHVHKGREGTDLMDSLKSKFSD